MEPSRFDSISRLFAERRLTRRQALAQAGAGLAVAGGLATATAAQDATPEPSTPATEERLEFLFLQSFQSGSIVPSDAGDGRFSVTLEHGLGQTLYFSDRPERIVGTNPTGAFLDGLGFRESNPPNAALVLETAPGETALAVVELFEPEYDPAGPTLTYQVSVLEGWEESLSLGFTAAPSDLATLAPEFGSAHLFIDDCADGIVTCTSADTTRPCESPDGTCGSFPSMGFCYDWSTPGCWPCEPYGHDNPDFQRLQLYWDKKCNATFASCFTDGREDIGCFANFI